MQKKIMIADCQVFQEPAWHRGMGKYSLSLLKGLLSNTEFTNSYELILLFNKNLPLEKSMLETVTATLNDFDSIELDLPVYANGKSLVKVQAACQEITDDYCDSAYSGQDVTFIIMSLFLQFACPVFPTNAKKVLLYYDLIMLQYYRMYLGLGHSEQHFAHYKTLFQSDMILSISKTVANDLTLYLGITKEKIANIDGAPIKRQGIKSAKPNTQIAKKYILMPSGGDPRKNNHRAVRGFSLFNQNNNNDYCLVLTSMFGDGMKKELHGISNDVVFTGNVEESELAWLYENCEAVLFAPEYEGLGLPILEAADYKKPVACSDISVFREMSNHAFYFFDHMSPEDIARSLQEAVEKVDWLNKQKEYPAILAEYSWEHTTQKTLSALSVTAHTHVKKKKLAVIAPNIQMASFSGYIAALRFQQYAEEYEVHYYYDCGVRPLIVRPNHLAYVTKVELLTSLTKNDLDSYDKVVAYVQDSSDSAFTIPKVLAVGCNVELFSSKLSVSYELMKQESIIASGRLLLEEAINEVVATDSYLSSFIAAAQTMTVYTEEALQQVSAVSKKLEVKNNVTKSTLALPQLPYTIQRSTTQKRTLLYISALAKQQTVQEIILSSISGDLVDFLFSATCSKDIEMLVRDTLNTAEVINGPTDFETISMIQRASGVIVVGETTDIEAQFIQCRSVQLGVPCVYVSNKTKHIHNEVAEFISKARKGIV